MAKEYWQDELTRTVTLAGGFVAALSNSERNEWHEYASALPEFKEYVDAQNRLSAQLVVAGGGNATGNDAERLRAAMAEECNFSRPLYAIAKAWHGQLVKRREAKEAVDTLDNEKDN